MLDYSQEVPIMTNSAPVMPLNKVVNSIKRDFAGYTYAGGTYFSWSARNKTITHPRIHSLNHVYLLLHEIAHAELKHSGYTRDIQLIQNEAKAWQFAAKNLAPHYELEIELDAIEDALDTYRLWLHHRSLCPECAQTGVQQNENTYSCLNCRCLWRVNEARLCGMRRKTLKQ